MPGLVYALLMDGWFSRLDAAIMLGLFGTWLVVMIRHAHRHAPGTEVAEKVSPVNTIAALVLGLALLIARMRGHQRPSPPRTIQNTLFKVGSILANDAEHPFDLGFDIVQSDVELLEQWIDKMDGQLEPLKNFILPGGHTSVSHAQIARTVCRRAERLCVALNKVIALNPLVIMYLNRLSDLLFTYARYLSKTLGAEEIVWKV